MRRYNGKLVRARALLEHWKEQEHFYVPRVDDATFARKTNPVPGINRKRTNEPSEEAQDDEGQPPQFDAVR